MPRVYYESEGERLMDREKFKEQMKKPSWMSTETMNNIQVLHITNTDEKEIYIVAMEEMAELQKEVSKQLRGLGDRDGILEEIADVTIVLGNITCLQGITEDELKRAVEVKLERILAKTANEEKEDSNETKCKVDSVCPHSGIGCGSCGNSSRYGEVHHQSGKDTWSKPD